jgi:hypothetical protein
MFEKNSRYASLEPLILTDARGREVEATAFAPAPQETFRGIHVLRQGERIDHLATHYLSNSTGYWRIAELNDAMTAEVLTEQREIRIPTKK